MPSSTVIEVHDVAKTYRGGIQALQGASIQVESGEVFGLLGSNGAGKSTLVKVLMTIIRPTRCSGTLLGQPIGHRPTLAKVGYLPEHVLFPTYLTGRQVIDMVAGLHGKSPKEVARKADELLELVGMRDRANDPLKTYSKGMNQRIGIAQALINDPQIVFLDEPTDGVDPLGRKEIRDVLVRMRDDGRTVFVNSHLLGELEMICDRVAILSQGEVVQQGLLSELLKSRGHYEIEVALDSPPIPPIEANSDLPLLTQLGSRSLRVDTHEAAAIQPLLDHLRSAGCVVAEVRPIRRSLEDLFIETVASPPPPPIPPSNSQPFSQASS